MERLIGHLYSANPNTGSNKYLSNSNSKTNMNVPNSQNSFNNLDTMRSNNKQNLIESINKNMFSPRVVKGISIEEEKPNKFDVNSAEEISDNLELFKLEITNKLLKIQKSQSKIKVTELMTELSEFKDHFKNTMESTNKRREEELKKLIQEMNSVKEDINKSVITETQKPRQEFLAFKNEFRNYKGEMHAKMDILEEKQRKQMEQIRVLMYNSSDKRIQELSSKFLPDNQGGDQIKDQYVKPTDNEINLMIEDLNMKKNKKNKDITRRDTLQDENEIKNFLKKKKTTQMKFQRDADIIEEEKDDDLNNLEDFKVNKLTDVNEKTKFKRKEQYKKEVLAINKRLADIENDDYKLTKLNKLRSYVHAVLLQVKLKFLNAELDRSTRLEALRHFSDHYTYVYTLLKNWVTNSTKMAYLSVKNFENIQMDITTYDSFSKGSKITSNETSDKFIKLQIRLKSFIDQMLENLTEKVMDYNTVAFLKILTEGNAILPFKFYSLFELTRLEIQNGQISGTNDNQKIMIILFYIIFKILIKNVLCETNGIKSQNVRKNLKMIASVYFHSVLDHFKSSCDLKANLNKDLTVKNQIEGPSGDFTEMKNKRGIHKGYVFAVNKYAKKKIQLTSAEEKQLLNKISKEIPQMAPDDDCNDVEFLSRNLFKRNEIDAYFEVAKQQNFNVTNKILELGNKFLGMINKGKKKKNV